MDKLRNYDVAFSGLKDGKHQFRFEIDNAFFQLFETEQEFTNPRIEAKVLMEKHSTFLEFWINTSGTVELICDISTESFDAAIASEVNVLVKFGEEYDDSNEEVIIIPANDYVFNVAQLIYENIILSVPMKKISPNLDEKDLEILKKYQPKVEEEPQKESDPRWDALRKLKDNN